MPTKQRIEPNIPDHEVLRKIGGGAYGEVWMARGITGAYRAVKVVRREDFDDERSFEREFEGILKFEPISRDHPGLVNILHVGRSNDGEEAFYYYVMELGDDIRAQREINPVEYEARTLRSDITRAKGAAQDTRPCIEIGIRLADALEHLHERGLAHRDVKPANVIFVNGKAKLADIGLVADRGQRTFVGTEGFVPPEGPGSAQADVYSLGKVLYEISTGKDRLQFPEVPEELHPDTDPKQWLDLNQVICDICEPKISKRTITSASQLAESLRRVHVGKKPKTGATGLYSKLLWLALIGFTGYAIYLALPFIKGKQTDLVIQPIDGGEEITGEGGSQDPNNDGSTGDSTNLVGGELGEAKFCIVNFDVDPFDAVVYSLEGEIKGEIDEVLQGIKFEVGTKLHYVLKKEGYEDLLIHYEVPDQSEVFPSYTMKLDQPPIIGKRWWDSLDQMYFPEQNGHVSDLVSSVAWELFTEQDLSIDGSGVREVEHKFNDGRTGKVICVSRLTADRMAEWLTLQSIKEGRLEEDQEIVVLFNGNFQSPHLTPEMQTMALRPFRLKAQMIPYASMVLQTIPKGAKVWLNDELLGLTDNEFRKIRPGEKVLEIQKDGYKTYRRIVDFKGSDLWAPRLIKLEKNDSLIWGKPWVKKTGMKFVPLSETLMASSFETRVRDFQRFVEAKGSFMPSKGVNDKKDEPVVGVSYLQALEYAEWLTETDVATGLITKEHRYRLPNDKEWSLMAGLTEREASVATLALENLDQYPWDGNWESRGKSRLVPLVDNAEPVGNFSDESRKKFNPKLDNSKYYKGYQDGNSGTSEVGIFMPNRLGIYDLAGNVSEWVSSSVGNNGLRVVRGSNFTTYLNKDLPSSYRTYLREGLSAPTVGFRLVIEYTESEEDGGEAEEELSDFIE